jgi:uncharacterized RDD family membrane protein YckC
VQLDNTVEVETPEQVRFRFRAAGPTRRAWAYLLDWLIRAGILLAFEMILVLGAGVHVGVGGSGDSGGAIVTGGTLLALFFIEWAYYVAFETAWNGTTPGKRALRLRVVKTGGYPLSFMDAVLRNLLRTADFLPVGYLLGLLVMVWDGRFARLGDRAAGTMVVIEDPVRVPPPITLLPPPTPTELEAFAHHASLALPEREAIELLLRRRDLSPARRVELAEMVAPMLSARLGTKPNDPVRFLALLHYVVAGGGTSPPNKAPGRRAHA